MGGNNQHHSLWKLMLPKISEAAGELRDAQISREDYCWQEFQAKVFCVFLA